MPPLKLTKLPDRKPVRITVKVDPELNRSLERYAALYGEVYGETESVATLIPFMLERFLNEDRAFTKASKRDGAEIEAGGLGSSAVQSRRGRRPENPASSANGTSQCP
jgi:hypothetical protein